MVVGQLHLREAGPHPVADLLRGDARGAEIADRLGDVQCPLDAQILRIQLQACGDPGVLRRGGGQGHQVDVGQRSHPRLGGDTPQRGAHVRRGGQRRVVVEPHQAVGLPAQSDRVVEQVGLDRDVRIVVDDPGDQHAHGVGVGADPPQHERGVLQALLALGDHAHRRKGVGLAGLGDLRGGAAHAEQLVGDLPHLAQTAVAVQDRHDVVAHALVELLLLPPVVPRLPQVLRDRHLGQVELFGDLLLGAPHGLGGGVLGQAEQVADGAGPRGGTPGGLREESEDHLVEAGLPPGVLVVVRTAARFGDGLGPLQPSAPPVGLADQLVACPQRDPAHAANPGDRLVQQVVHRLAEQHAGGGVQCVRAESGLVQRGPGGGVLGVAPPGVLVVGRRARGALGDGGRPVLGLLEDPLPGLAHLGERVEPALGPAVQGASEEGGQRLAELVGKVLFAQAGMFDVVGEETRLDAVLAPGGQVSRRHLVQGDRDGVAFGRAVVTALVALGVEERVEVARGPRPGVLLADAGQGEVEQHQLAALLVALAHPQVGGFDVAVEDPLVLQVVGDLEQVDAEAAQFLDTEAALQAQIVGEGEISGEFELQYGALADGQDRLVADRRDDAAVAQPLELLGLPAQLRRGAVADRHLEDPFLTAALHEQRAGGGALAEDASDRPPVDDLLPLDRDERVGDHVGAGQELLDLVDAAQELAGGAGALAGGAAGGLAHQGVHDREDVVVDRGGGEFAVLADVFADLLAVAARRPTGEHQEGQRAQPEHVERARVAVEGGELGGQVGLRGGLHVVGQGAHGCGLAGVPGGGLVGGVPAAVERGAPTCGDLPVGDAQPRIVAVQFHPDAARGQGAVEQPVAVGVVDGLGELADHLGPGVGVEVGAVLLHEVVEPLPASAVLEHDRRAASVDHLVVFGLDDALVGDAVEGAELAFGGAPHGLPGGVVLGVAVVVDAYSALLAPEDGVLAEVIGPGGAAVERAAAQDVGADLQVPVDGLCADLLHQPGDGAEEHRVGAAADRPVEQAVPDALEPGLLLQSVAAVDVLALDLVELAAQVGC